MSLGLRYRVKANAGANDQSDREIEMTTIETAKTMRKSQVIKALQGLGVTNIRPSGKFAIVADLDYGRGKLNGLYDPRDLLVELTSAPAPEEPKAEPVKEPEPVKADPAPVKKASRKAEPVKASKKAVKAATPKAPAPEKAITPKVKRLELTTRQREVLREDARDAGLKADVEKGKQVTMTAGVMEDLGTFAARAGTDAAGITRQRVYQGLLSRAKVWVKENGLTTK